MSEQNVDPHGQPLAAPYCSAACRDFIEAVTRNLHSIGWNVRDDGDCGLPDDFLKSELAAVIFRHAYLIENDSWKAQRIAILQKELELLSE